MVKIEKNAQAGTLESSDIMITIAPGMSGMEIELESIVLAQYGDAIRLVIVQTLQEQGINDIRVRAVDKGALDCTIRARILTALGRAGVELKEAAV